MVLAKLNRDKKASYLPAYMRAYSVDNRPINMMILIKISIGLLCNECVPILSTIITIRHGAHVHRVFRNIREFEENKLENLGLFSYFTSRLSITF